MADGHDEPPGLRPRLCWLPLQRCRDTLGELLGGVVLMADGPYWINVETGLQWNGDPFTNYVGAVELGPVTR